MSRPPNRGIVLGVAGGIAAYKAADLVRRLRRPGFRGEGGDDRGGPGIRGSADLPGALLQPGALRAARRAGRGRDGTHRARPMGGPGARRAGHRRRARAARARAGRRSPHHALPGDDGAAGARAGDEPADVALERDPGERADAARPGRRDAGSGGRRPGVRRGRAGPDAGARGDRGPDRSPLRRRRAGGASTFSSPPAPPGRPSIRCASSPTTVPGRWDTRSRRRRRRRARACRW